MQDNVTMTERDKMGLFQTKYSVAILVNSPHKSLWKWGNTLWNKKSDSKTGVWNYWTLSYLNHSMISPCPHYTFSEYLNIMYVLLQARQQITNHGISSSIRNNHLIAMVIMCPDLFKITTQINNFWRASIWIGIRPRYVQNNNLRVLIHRKWIRWYFWCHRT